MNKPLFCGSLFTVIAIFAGNIVLAGDQTSGAVKVLQIDKTTEKVEIRESQIGYRDTLIFYTFKDKNAVLQLKIDNKAKAFPMTGNIFVFADSVKNEDVKKWLNNQHSDALFADAPEPTAVLKLPADSCMVQSRKFIGNSRESFGEYDNYSVTFEVKDYSDRKSVSLKGFSGTAKVHVKTK